MVGLGYEAGVDDLKGLYKEDEVEDAFVKFLENEKGEGE